MSVWFRCWNAIQGLPGQNAKLPPLDEGPYTLVASGPNLATPGLLNADGLRVASAKRTASNCVPMVFNRFDDRRSATQTRVFLSCGLF
jgi:hypothetical protein